MAVDDERAVAIIGMAALFPGAPDLATYWENLKSGFDAITEAPASRWDPLFYAPGSGDVDRIYCRRGGFVDAYSSFDALAFGVMPASAGSAEPDQLLGLQVAAAALADAGYGEGGRALQHDRAGILLGRGGYVNAGVARLEQRVRTAEQLVQSLRALLPSLGDDDLARVKAEFQQAVGPYGGGDSFIGLVPNLAASRIANRLDLRGPAYTVDAACASSLVAVDHARRELLSGRCDLVLAGGVHLCQEVTFWAGFCQLGAVSREERIRPFDRRADGLLLGEGIGIVALRRLADAERDGDRIYAVLRGTAVASDGRATSLMTPAVEGQLRALRDAWSEARLDPATVGLIEAHGTATPAGDLAELTTLARMFGRAAPGEARAGLGTVKSMIGHAMPAAGAAGLIKAALAIHHGVLPPTLHCEEPHALLAETRFRPIHRAEPWDTKDGARRAGVNAFGFGGINAHVVLEAHAPSRRAGHVRRTEIPEEAEDVLLLAAETTEALLEAIDRGRRELGAGPARLAVFDPSPERLARARAIVARGVAWSGRNDLWFSPRGLVASGGRVAFVFPGVDASFDPKVADVARRFGREAPVVGEGLERIGQAILAVGRLLDGALRGLGASPDLIFGHSIGEWSGMIASGMIADADVDPFIASLAPGSLEVPGVVFAAAGCDASRAGAALADLPDVAISHDNCPHQIVLCGVEASIDAALARLVAGGVLCQKLSFRSGYHSPLFAGYVEPYRHHVERLRFSRPSVPLWSATTAAPYPDDAEAIRALTVSHLVHPVRFRELTLAVHEAGARVFIQVGTGSLVGFLGDTLRGLPHLAISANVPQRAGMAQLRRVIAALFVEGAAVPVGWLAASAGPAGGSASLAAKREGPRVRLALGAPLVRLKTPLVAPRFEAPASRPSFVAAEPGARFVAAEPGARFAGAEPGARVLGEGKLATAFDAVMEEVASARSAVLDALASGRPSSRGPRSSRRGRPEEPRAAGARQATYRRALSVDAYPALRDHAFYPQPEGWPHIEDRYPVVPLTMTIQLMLEAAAELVPDRIPVGLEELGAYRWIAVAPPIEVAITARHDGAGKVEVAIEGYAVATVLVAEAYPRPEAADDEPLEDPQSAFVRAAHLYRDGWMFHGPAYQGVVELGPIGRNGIDGVLYGLAAPGGLLDNAGQLLGYWVMEKTEVDRLAMPVRVRRMRLFGREPSPGERVECRVRVRHFDATDVRADMTLSAGGAPWARIEGWEDRRFDTDARSFPLLRKPARHTLSVAREEGYVVLVEPRRSIPSTERLVRRYLSGRERAAYEKVDLRARYGWLIGRVAIKDAVRDRLWKDGAGPLFPIEVEVAEDGSGRPVVSGAFAPMRVAAAWLDGAAVAIAGSEAEVLAIGLSPIDAPGDGAAMERAQERAASDARAALPGEVQGAGETWIESQMEGDHAVAWIRRPGP